MTSMSDWSVNPPPPKERHFFTEFEWQTIDAATARIIPTDQDPGAREAQVVRFIDRYLAGIDYIFAAADGHGFLQLSGKAADAWRARIADMQETYRQGIRTLNQLAMDAYGSPFKDLGEDEQDQVLERLSGSPKPTRVQLQGQVESIGYGTIQIFMFDDGLGFFSALTTHTRQGFYCDPVYGGNADFVGWKVIGFPGPRSLQDTIDGTYSTREYFVQEYDWRELIPHLNESEARD